MKVIAGLRMGFGRRMGGTFKERREAIGSNMQENRDCKQQGIELEVCSKEMYICGTEFSLVLWPYHSQKASSYHFGTGAAYCISSSLMKELEPYLRYDHLIFHDPPSNPSITTNVF